MCYTHGWCIKSAVLLCPGFLHGFAQLRGELLHLWHHCVGASSLSFYFKSILGFEDHGCLTHAEGKPPLIAREKSMNFNPSPSLGAMGPKGNILPANEFLCSFAPSLTTLLCHTHSAHLTPYTGWLILQARMGRTEFIRHL